jgi:hypothetical protein
MDDEIALVMPWSDQSTHHGHGRCQVTVTRRT